MKKILIAAIAFIAMTQTVNAQDAVYQTEENQIAALQEEVNQLKHQQEEQALNEKLGSIWGRTKFLDVNYVWSNLTLPDVKKKSNAGVALNLGNTYYLHKKPLLGMIKIGLDAVWMDLNYATYKKGDFKIPSLNPDDYDFDGNGDYGNYEDWEDEVEFGNFGWHKIDLGIGVGPSVNIAPFSSCNNALQHLKAQLFFHFTPSYTALLMSDDDETKFYHGFSPVLNFGGAITWKMIGLGVEGRWCTAKFNLVDGEDNNSKDKVKTSSCRLFIRLNF